MDRFCISVCVGFVCNRQTALQRDAFIPPPLPPPLFPPFKQRAELMVKCLHEAVANYLTFMNREMTVRCPVVSSNELQWPKRTWPSNKWSCLLRLTSQNTSQDLKEKRYNRAGAHNVNLYLWELKTLFIMWYLCFQGCRGPKGANVSVPLVSKPF